MRNEGLENRGTPSIYTWSKNEGTPFIYTCQKKDFEKFKEYAIHEIPYLSLPYDHHFLPSGELCERVLYGIAQGYSRDDYIHKFDDGAASLFEDAKFTHQQKVVQDFPRARDEIVFTSNLRPSEIPVEKRPFVSTLLFDKYFQKLQSIARFHIEILAMAYRHSSDDYNYILRNSSGIHAIQDIAEEKLKDLEAYKEACRSGIASEPKYSRRILDLQERDKGVWKAGNHTHYTFGEGRLSKINFFARYAR